MGDGVADRDDLVKFGDRLDDRAPPGRAASGGPEHIRRAVRGRNDGNTHGVARRGRRPSVGHQHVRVHKIERPVTVGAAHVPEDCPKGGMHDARAKARAGQHEHPRVQHGDVGDPGAARHAAVRRVALDAARRPRHRRDHAHVVPALAEGADLLVDEGSRGVVDLAGIQVTDGQNAHG